MSAGRSDYPNLINNAIGMQESFRTFAAMHILNSKKGTYFVADILINCTPELGTLIDIAHLLEVSTVAAIDAMMNKRK